MKTTPLRVSFRSQLAANGVRLLAVLALLLSPLLVPGRAATCPPIRSTHYSGSPTAHAEYKSQTAWDASIAMTLEAWVYREDGGRCETIISHDYTKSWWFGFCQTLRFYRSGGVSADADVEVPANQWCHVAASYDGTTVRFYVNGAPAGEKALSNTGAQFSGPVFVGADPAGFPFKGSLDEIRLWSTARSKTEIQGGMFSELRGSPDLTAVWDTGGRSEGVTGTTVALGAGASEQVLGIHPRDLIIPRAAGPVTFDGWPQFDTEYAGAERLVIRYHDGPKIIDLAAALVYRDAPGDRALYIGLTGIREPVGVPRSGSFIGLGLDPDFSGNKQAQSDDFQFHAYLDNTVRTLVGNGVGGLIENPALADRWDVKFNFTCSGDLSPACIEFRIPEATLGSLLENDGLMMGHFGVIKSGDGYAGPSNAGPTSPATWVKATYCDAKPAPGGPRIFGTISQGSLSLKGVLVALDGPQNRVTTTDEKGTYSFDNLPAGDYRVVPFLIGYDFTPAIAVLKGVTKDRSANFSAKKSDGKKPVFASEKPSGTILQFDRRFYATGDTINAKLSLTYDSSATELHAFVVSSETGDIELLTLKRDGSAPRTYRSLAGVPTQAAGSTIHDGKLSVKPGEKLSVLYYVDEDRAHPPMDEHLVGDVAFVLDPDFAGAPVVLKSEVALTPDELTPPPGGKRIGTLLARDGWPIQIPVDELILSPRDGNDLKRFLEVTKGSIIASDRGAEDSPNDPPKAYLVRVNPAKVQPAALRQMRAFMGQQDEVFCSNPEVQDLWGTALELQMQGFVVAANPRLQFYDTPGPQPSETGAGDGTSRTMQNEGPMNVPQLWAFLALWDRDEARIPVGILDVGFAPSPDLRTPLIECDMEASGPGGMVCGPGRAFGAQRVGNSLFGPRTWHGTGVATTLGGKLNNRWTPSDGETGGRAGVGGQVVVPMLYQYGLLSYVFEFGAGMRKASIDGATVINISGGYPCRIVDSLGIGFNVCSVGGRAALCATATAILAAASAAICATAALTAAIPFVGPIIAIPLFIACGVATVATVAGSTACFATLLLGDPRDPMIDGVRFATDRGVAVVVSAGNRLQSDVLPPIVRDLINFSDQRIEDWQVFPAVIEPCITVGATEDRWPFANQHFFGNRVNIWAPIFSAYYRPEPEDHITPANLWIRAYLGGTSGAAPYVTGTIAAMQAVNPTLNPRNPALSVAQRLAIPGRLRGILTNSAWTTAELAAMAPDPATAAAVNAGAPQRRHLINPFRAVQMAAAGVIPDFAPLGYDTRMNFNETTPVDAADNRADAQPLVVGTTQTATIINIRGEDGAPDRADVDWWRFTMPAGSGLYVGRLQLMFPRGFGDLTLDGLRLVRTETVGVETRLTFETITLFNNTDFRFAVRGVAGADNVYKLTLLEIRFIGSPPAADRFDVNLASNPVRPDNNDRSRAVPLGSDRVVNWSEQHDGSYDTYREIAVRGVNFHSSSDVDWYQIVAFPDIAGCLPSLEIHFPPGVRCTVIGPTARSETSVLASGASSPLILGHEILPPPPVYIKFENLDPASPTQYDFRLVYRSLREVICTIAESSRERGVFRGRDFFGGGRFPFPDPAPDEFNLKLGDFLDLPDRGGDPFGRVINPEWHFIEWRGGGDFGADFELPGNASLRVRLLDLKGAILAEIATPDLLNEKPGPPDNYAGARTISLRRPSLSPGTYILEFSQGSFGILIGLNLPRNATRNGLPGLEDLQGTPQLDPPALSATPDFEPGKSLLRLKWALTDAVPLLEESDALEFGGNWRSSPVPLTVGDEGFETSIPFDISTKFFRLRPHPDRCTEPGLFAVGPRPNPWFFGGYKYSGYTTPGGAPLPLNHIRVEGSSAGLDVNTLMTVEMPGACREVTVEFTSQSGLVDFLAYDGVGAGVDSQRVLGGSLTRRSVTLRSSRSDIHSVSVLSPNARTVIHKVCCKNSDLLPGPGIADECHEFRFDPIGPVSNPLESSKFKITSTLPPASGGILDPSTRIESVSGFIGYHVQYRTEVELRSEADSVIIDFVQFSGRIDFQAFDSGGGLVDSRTVSGVTGAPQTVILGTPGTRIRRVIIVSPNDLMTILRLCGRGMASVTGTEGSCVDLRTPLGAKPNPYHVGSVEILRRNPDGTPSASNSVIARDGEQGVEIGGGQTEILLPAACGNVTLKLAMDGGHFDLEAQDAGYRTLDRVRVSGPGPRVVTVMLRGAGITRILLKSSDAKGVLAEICCQN